MALSAPGRHSEAPRAARVSRVPLPKVALQCAAARETAADFHVAPLERPGRQNTHTCVTLSGAAKK